MVKINNTEIRTVHVFYALAGALLAVLLLNVFLASSLSEEMGKNAQPAAEQAKPAEISIVTISAPADCAGCFDVGGFVSQLKSQGAAVAGEKTLMAGSGEAQQLISRYQIDRLPTAIVTGELGKNGALGVFLSGAGELKDGSRLEYRRRGLPGVFPVGPVELESEVANFWSLREQA